MALKEIIDDIEMVVDKAEDYMEKKGTEFIESSTGREIVRKLEDFADTKAGQFISKESTQEYLIGSAQFAKAAVQSILNPHSCIPRLQAKKASEHFQRAKELRQQGE